MYGLGSGRGMRKPANLGYRSLVRERNGTDDSRREQKSLMRIDREIVTCYPQWMFGRHAWEKEKGHGGPARRQTRCCC